MRTLFDIGQVLTFILAFYGWNWLVLRLMTASLRDLRISLLEQLIMMAGLMSSLLIFPFILTGEVSLSLFIFLLVAMSIVSVVPRVIPQTEEEGNYHAGLISWAVFRKTFTKDLPAGKAVAAIDRIPHQRDGHLLGVSW